MRLHIHCGNNLPALDSNGTSDPFVKVYYDNKTLLGETSVRRRTVNPIWNEAIEFELKPDLGMYYVVLEVWDKDDLSKNDIVGYSRVPFDYVQDIVKHKEKKLWVKLIREEHAKGQVLVHLEYSDADIATLKLRRPKTDIRDVYPPHNPRFKRAYHHIPRSWHPDPAVRDAKGARQVIFPQHEIILHMVEHVIITPHIDQSVNKGTLATMVLTNYRLWFVPYERVDEKAAPADVHYITVGKIAKPYLVQPHKLYDKKAKELVLENMDGGVYHVLLSRMAFNQSNKDSEEAEGKRDQSLLNIINELKWLQAENNFCVTPQKHTHWYAEEDQDEKVQKEEEIKESDVVVRLPRLSHDSISARFMLRRRYDPIAEFQRQGVLSHSRWRVSEVNEQYELCATYPRVLIVPAAVQDETLHKASEYRTKRRLPTLTWLHPKYGASLTRSSQPHSGVMKNINEGDTELMLAIHNAGVIKTAPSDEAPQSKLTIVDARPEINAKGNALAGRGHESAKHYMRDGKPCAEIKFMGIDNIHVVRSCFSAFSSAFYGSDDSSFYGSIQKSKWLEHVAAILQSSSEVAQQLSRGESVLVHCSDGWDRTSQLCSLAQLMLDPFYRTMEGFLVLIEKDWCSFGHMFHRRCRFPLTDQTSPIFILFLDAVFQLLHQFPSHFQFNAVFLIHISQAVYSNWFGTFIMNSEKERAAFAEKYHTIPLWDALRANTDYYINPLFKPHQEEADFLGQPLFPVCRVRVMQIWSGLYYKAQNTIRIQHKENEMMALIREQEDQINAMQRLLTPNQQLQLKADQYYSDILTISRSFELDDDGEDMQFLAKCKLLHKDARANSFDGDENPALVAHVEELHQYLKSLMQQLQQRDERAADTLNTFRHQNYRLPSRKQVATEKTIDYDEVVKLVAPVWQRDQAASVCKQCRKKFRAIYRGKHHCRSCGFVFCHRCSSYDMRLPDYGYVDSVRVCVNCHRTKNQEKTIQS